MNEMETFVIPKKDKAIAEKVGSRLESLIYETGLSQNEFAYIVDTSPATLCRYIKGQRLPTIDFFVQCSVFFNTSVDYMLGISDERGIKGNPDADYVDEMMEVIGDKRRNLFT